MDKTELSKFKYKVAIKGNAECRQELISYMQEHKTGAMILLGWTIAFDYESDATLCELRNR